MNGPRCSCPSKGSNKFSLTEWSRMRPCSRRSSGTSAMPWTLASRGLFKRTCCPRTSTAGADRIDAEKHPGKLGAAAAHQPGQAEDLPFVQGETDVVDPGAGLQVARLKQCGLGKRTIPFLVLELIFDLPPDDALDDLRGRHLTEPLGEKLLSVAQDGDAVGNPVNLIHSVGDVDDRDSACLQPCD